MTTSCNSERPLSLDELRALMLPILAGVGHAHQRGIIHRDIKPANILLARSEDVRWLPKVTDFGIAKVTDEAGGSLAVNKKSTNVQRMGTLSYMSPEQIRAPSTVTARSDVFSLGALLYELATGTVAFEGASQYDVMDNIMKGIYEPPQRRAASLGADVAAAMPPRCSPTRPCATPVAKTLPARCGPRARRGATGGRRQRPGGRGGFARPASGAPVSRRGRLLPPRPGRRWRASWPIWGRWWCWSAWGSCCCDPRSATRPRRSCRRSRHPKSCREKLAPPADASSTASGLRFKTERAGTGSHHPKAYDAVTVHYTGWTMDGRKFDSSVDSAASPRSFPWPASSRAGARRCS